MRISFAPLTLIAVLLGACATVPAPENRSASDPSDASAPEASARPFHPDLVGNTQVYLDSSVGRGAQKMDHSSTHGTARMAGMDHSKMAGMDSSLPSAGPPPEQPVQMQQMDHTATSQWVAPAPEGTMSPASKEVLQTRMQQTADEMRKLSDELNAKAGAAKTTGASVTPEPSPQAAIYTCPMHLEVKQPGPGNCPKCGMTLVSDKGKPQ